ncbi:MAG TPA: ELWxxDGT repeat protein, partial [Chryseosolibacter sp.]|nr:ELWxxDGT repeat protein [Chryseosolibacter sp.]
MRKELPSLLRLAKRALRRLAFVSGSSLLFTLAGQPSVAQLQLLKDINTSEEASYSEYSLLTHGIGRMYYVSENELWKSNGTPESTQKLKSFKSISGLTMVGTTLYFAADDGTSGAELWKSNGTVGSTVRVKDIMEGPEGSSPHNLTAVGSALFFAAYRSTAGIELWRSDGTSAGTTMVKDIARGNSSPRNMVNVNGVLFFSATDGVNGHELWKSDGTAANTVMIKNIYAGKSNAYPEQLTAYGGKVYFSAYEPASGRELWVSDGTSAGTTQLKDIRPGSQSSTPENLIVIKDKLMFTAHDGDHGDELWQTNGTISGTAMVKDMNPGGAGSNSTVSGRTMRAFSNMNGLLYFIAAKGDKEYIYRSDGTEAGTIILKQAYGVLSEAPQPEFTYMKGYVYFFNAESSFSESQALLRIPYRGTPQEISFVRYFDGPFSWYADVPPVRNEMIHFYNNLYF